MEVENYIYKDNPLYPTPPYLHSPPFGGVGGGFFLSVDNITVLVLILIETLLVCSHSAKTHTYI